MPSRRYDTPSGKVGRRFVVALEEEIRRVRDRRWNSEWFLIFQTVILQQACHFTASHAIRRRIKKRLDALEAGHHGFLVEEILRTCAQYLTPACREESEDHRAETFHILVLRGKLLMAVRCITEQETRGRATSGGAVHQDQGEGDGGAAH